MLAKVNSGTTVGLEATLIEVEVDIPNEGLPAFFRKAKKCGGPLFDNCYTQVSGARLLEKLLNKFS